MRAGTRLRTLCIAVSLVVVAIIPPPVAKTPARVGEPLVVHLRRRTARLL